MCLITILLEKRKNYAQIYFVTYSTIQLSVGDSGK